MGIKTGTLKPDGSGDTRPASVLQVPGTGWARLNIMEWSSLQTLVFTDPGTAAAKLVAIRSMLRQPCSYRFTTGYVVARLSEDRPNVLVVQGAMPKVPMVDVFIRHGNTITYYSAIMVISPSNDVITMVQDVLAAA